MEKQKVEHMLPLRLLRNDVSIWQLPARCCGTRALRRGAGKDGQRGSGKERLLIKSGWQKVAGNCISIS